MDKLPFDFSSIPPIWALCYDSCPQSEMPQRKTCGRHADTQRNNSEFAAGRTLELGQQFGNGSLWNLLFPSPDTSNSYDNAMIKRATDWAKNRYSLSPVRTYNGGYEIGVVRKDYSPANMRVYTIKKNKQ